MTELNSSGQEANLLLQADWDDSALIAAFDRHYKDYNEYHQHGSDRPKKKARTQFSLHMHNPKPKAKTELSETTCTKGICHEEGEPVLIINDERHRVEPTAAAENDEKSEEEQKEEEEEGAIADDIEKDLNSCDQNMESTIENRLPAGTRLSSKDQLKSYPTQIPPAMVPVPPPPSPNCDHNLYHLLLSWYYAGYYARASESYLKLEDSAES